MQITKFTQDKKSKPRLTALKKQELIEHLAAVKELLSVEHKVDDLQVVFTGVKKETFVVINR